MKFVFSMLLVSVVFNSGCSSIAYRPTLQQKQITINDQTDSISSKQAPSINGFPKFIPQKVNHFQLKNGLTVLHFQSHQEFTATTLLGLFLHNPDPYNPINLKLNANWNLIKITENEHRLTSLAANIGTNIQRVSDSIATGWYFEVLQKDQQKALKLLSYILNNRVYSGNELTHQKQNYSLEQQLRNVNGLSLSQQLYKNLVFSKQSAVSKLSRASSRKKILEKITVNELQKYFNQNFNANKMVLIILSATPLEQIKTTIEKSFKQFPILSAEKLNETAIVQSSAAKTPSQLSLVRPQNSIYAISRPQSTQVDIRISFTPLVLQNNEYHSMKLIADVLAGRSLNSRMQSDLRERQGLSYSISHQLNQISDFHSLHFLASTENHKLPALFYGMQQHINYLLENGISQNEFNFIKQRRLVNLQRRRLHPYLKMSFMLQNFTNENPLDKISYEAQELSRLTFHEFQAFVKRLQKQPQISIFTGDKSSIKHHLCKLKQCRIQWFNKQLSPQK